MSNFQLSILFFLQFAVIIAACRVVGLIGKRFGQAQVVGEMVAGILLGPSLFGWLAPHWHELLFPAKLLVNGNPVIADGKPLSHPLMTVIYCIAQIGLAAYMFLVGVDFKADLIRQRARSAASVSIAGIIVPMCLGAVIAYLLRDNRSVFKADVTFWQNALFLGAAMAITAFPVLARILSERNITNTPLGTLALAAGAGGDAAAWCIFAVVLASFKSDPQIAGLAIGGGVVYAVFVLTLGRRLIAWGLDLCHKTPLFKGLEIPGLLALLMLASWYTDYIGIYAVFGAFILGLAIPRGETSRSLQRLLEPAIVNLLLPMYFVYSGLNTRITLVNTPKLWAIAALLLGASILGKGVACYLAARWHGESKRESLAIGALMNARGMMELILLNIGRDLGIITDELFSMMVIMTLVTTLMATPIFDLVYRTRSASNKAVAA